MQDNLSFCETLVREDDHDRFLATLFAPAAARSWLYALYAFDLETARVSSRVTEPLAGEIRLQWWNDIVTGVGREQAAGSPVAASLAALVEHFPAASERLLRIVEARREQLYAHPEALPDLEERLGKGEGAVFGVAALLLGVSMDDALELLCRRAGIAFGLTRILESSAAPPDRASMILAHTHLDEARAALRAVPMSAWPAFLVLALARPTLNSLEHGGRLLQWRKQWVLWRAARNLPARI